MEITILGATGRTGVWALRKAIEAGHTVRAVVRDRAKLETMVPEIVGNDALTVVEADLLDGEAVREALAGSRVVIYAAGPVKSAPADMSVRAALNIVAAMNAGAGEKLVWLTGAGVLDSRDGKSGSRKAIRGLMKLVAGKVLAASEEAYELVKQSGLTYVVARPPMLADEPGGTDLSAGYEPPRPIPLGREDLGSFLVDAATSDRYDNESPFLSYRQRGALRAARGGRGNDRRSFARGAGFRDVDRVFLMRPPHISNIRRDMRPFLEYLARRNINFLAFLSVQGAEKSRIVPHAKIESELERLRIPHATFRPSFFMQNLTTTHMHEIRDERRIFVPAGDGPTNFVDTRDVGEAIARILMNPPSGNAAYTVTGLREHTYHEVVDILTRVVGEHVSYESARLIPFVRYHIARGKKLTHALEHRALFLQNG